MITSGQAIERGMSASAIRSRVKTGAWQRLHRGVYLTHNGPVSRTATIWVAVLAAGDGAAASHETAAELWDLTDEVQSIVHLTIPAHRRISSPCHVRIHHSGRIDAARHPARHPPRTRIDETVLDLVDAAQRPDDAVGWIVAASGRGLTTPAHIRVALDARPKIRWRSDIAMALTDVDDGNQSMLEIRYFRSVERAHGLPAGVRQAAHQRSGGHIYDDVRYAAFKTVVELDGRIAHPAEAMFRDLRRDNVAGIRGDVVLHYGWTDVVRSPCTIAIQVGSALQRAGWSGLLRACGSECEIR